jgi:hypothetical protein
MTKIKKISLMLELVFAAAVLGLVYLSLPQIDPPSGAGEIAARIVVAAVAFLVFWGAGHVLVQFILRLSRTDNMNLPTPAVGSSDASESMFNDHRSGSHATPGGTQDWVLGDARQPYRPSTRSSLRD